MTYTRAVLLMAKLFVQQTLLKRRGLIIGAFALDLLLVLVSKYYHPTSETAFAQLTRVLIYSFLLPFSGLFFGISVVQDEMENGTLPYLLARPIPRSSFLLGRCAVATLTVLLIAVGAALLNLAVLGGGENVTGIILGLVVGSVCYTALFTAIGAAFQRPFLIGLVFLVFVEFAMAQLPISARFVALRAHLENISGFSTEILGFDLANEVSIATSVAVALGATAVFYVAAHFIFRFREFTAD